MASLSMPTDVPSWRHGPLFIKPGQRESFSILDHSPNEPVPIGVPVEFTSEIFQGKILFRFCNVPSDDMEGCEAYFQGRARKYQTVIQGRFKENVAVDQLVGGNHQQKPLKMSMPKFIVRRLESFVSLLAPGLEVDLTSDKPYIRSLLAGGMCQILRVDQPGKEPNMCDIDLKEETSLLFPQNCKKTAAARQKHLSKPKHARKYSYEKDHVYTFEFYGDRIDYKTLHSNMGPLGNLDMANCLDGQPITFGPIMKDGRWMYRFHMFHQRMTDTDFDTGNTLSVPPHESFKRNSSLRRSIASVSSALKRGSTSWVGKELDTI